MNPLNIERMEQDAEKQAVTKKMQIDSIPQYSIKCTDLEERERIIELCYIQDWSEWIGMRQDSELYLNIEVGNEQWYTTDEPHYEPVILSTDIE